MSSLWHVRRHGRVSGPFPTGAVVADRLVGRVSAEDELSPDGEEWRAWDAWPELAAEVSGAPAATATAEPQWISERARARLRWVDERTGSERRGDDVGGSSGRRGPELERRVQDSHPGGNRTPPRPRRGITHDGTVLKIVLAIAVAAGMIAGLVWLFGPVNPVPVHIR